MDDRLLASAFGAQLRQVRKARGMSQDQLASDAKISRTSIVNIEAGRQGVALGTMYRLALALGVDPEELLPDQGLPEEEVPSIAIGGSTDDSERILRDFIRDLETGGSTGDS